MATTTTSERGGNLRAARERAGLTRIQLAQRIGCSLAQLANIEQGAVPKRSRVLEAAFDAVAEHMQDDADPDDYSGSGQRSASRGRHDES